MITLISPYSDITAYPVRILSAYVRSKGFKSRLIFFPDSKFGFNKDGRDPMPQYSDTVMNQLIDLCSDSSLIGFSLFTSDFPSAVYLTRCIKEKLNTPVIWGGKHPSAKPEEALSYADMVCIGEGEEALTELLGKIESGQDYHNTQNIWFKHNGTIIKNPIRPLIENLDLIPFPDYSFDNHYILEIETDKIIPPTPGLLKKHLSPDYATGFFPYETLFSRGCPFSCTYCFSFKKMYKGQKYFRFRSTENLIQELELIKEKLDYIQMIWLVDDNIFALSKEKIKEFCQIYKERIALPLTFAGHPKNINEEKLSYLIDAGFIRIHMGVQTGSKRTQKLYKRNIPDETILKAVHSICKFKDSLFACYDVIIDNPYETNEDLVDTIKLLLKFPKPRHIKLFSLTFFPGTELFEKAQKDRKLSHEDKFRAFRKDFLFFYDRKKKYLNFVFLLLNRKIPNFLINVLINKNVIFLLDRPLINELLFKVAAFFRGIRRKKENI